LEELIPEVFHSVFGGSMGALVVRADTGIRTLEGVSAFTKIVFGETEAVRSGTFSEGDVRYAADFLEGQKTGFFLDQRENRHYLRHSGCARGAHVLDLFCYSGGWGLSALKGGASHVTFVDESMAALELVKKGLALNGIDPARANFVQADAFDFLEADQNTYDVVVADPPAFVKSKKNLPQAIRAYEKCNRLALRRLKEKGLLLTSSCSYHLSAAEFVEVVQGAFGKESVAGHVVYQGRQAADHPILLSMPETNYLKCLGVRKI
jgi:23S rRNA (cytosine1962-C5)-methyltransferase